MSWVGGILGGTLLLTAAQALGVWLVPVPLPPMPPGADPWAIASNALSATFLTALALRSRWFGWRLAGGVFLVLYVITHASSLIEAFFFGFFGPYTTLGLLLGTAIASALFAAALVLLIGRARTAPAPAVQAGATPHLVRKLAACGAVYVVLYFAFGMMIYPFIRDFYGQRPMPSPLAIIVMQLVVRGPLFGAMMLLVTRMVNSAVSTNALFCALAMSSIGGVAPLVVPNPFFPDAVRYAHLVEVTTENFIFGWFTGWLFSARAHVLQHGARYAPTRP